MFAATRFQLASRFCLIGFLLLAAVPVQAADKPERIVSLSLCSDELVLLLADRERIASLSYLVADPAHSALAAETAGLHLNRGRAEEVLPLQPDLILSTRFSAGMASALLQGLGYRLETLGFPATLEAAYGQIRDVAALLGEPERGEALIRDIATSNAVARRQLAALDMQREPLALFYASNGFTFGSGTLRDDFLQSLGIRNLAAEAGIDGVRMLALESLIAAEPDFLLVNAAGSHDRQLAMAMLQHPVMQRQFGPEQFIVLPDVLFQCAGPGLIEAYRQMAGELAGRVHE